MAGWRDRRLSDWGIEVDGELYPVHKFVLALGDRRSLFFEKLLTSTQFAIPVDAKTDLSDLPEACKNPRVMESMLEWVYSGKSDSFEPSILNPLMVLADRLQIPTLQDAVINFLRLHTSDHYDFYLLNEATELKQTLCLPVLFERIASHFDPHEHFQALRKLPRFEQVQEEEEEEKTEEEKTEEKTEEKKEEEEEQVKTKKRPCASPGEEQSDLKRPRTGEKKTVPQTHLHNLSTDLICAILNHDQLRIHHEDYVFVYIKSYLSRFQLSDDEKQKLWSCCRFPFLSSDCLQLAFEKGAPAHLLLAAHYIRLVLNNSCDDRFNTGVVSPDKFPKLPGHGAVVNANQGRQRSCPDCTRVPFQSDLRQPTFPHPVYHAGVEIDIWCAQGRRWYHGIVLKAGLAPDSVLVHYLGWANRFDLELAVNSFWLAPLHTFTSPAPERNRHGTKGPNPEMRKDMAAAAASEAATTTTTTAPPAPLPPPAPGTAV